MLQVIFSLHLDRPATPCPPEARMSLLRGFAWIMWTSFEGFMGKAYLGRNHRK
jgi:hypothetical protein